MGRKVVLYIATSLDGYIAEKDDGLEFLNTVQATDEDYGYEDFQATVDTVIWGRKTFDKVLSFGGGIPHADKAVYIISRQKKGSEQHAVYHPDVVSLVRTLLQREGKDIYCDGGGEIVYELLKHRLIDRMIISVIPHLVGDGIRLFRGGTAAQELKYKRSIAYPSGLMQLWYDVVRNQKA